MGKKYKIILYILVLILVIAGAALFLWRESLISNINDNAGVTALESVVKTKKTSDDTLDTGILSEDKFVSLKANVVKFDFDSVCKESGAKIAVVSTVASEGTTTASTTVKQTGCLIGNSIPFPVPVKKAN